MRGIFKRLFGHAPKIDQKPTSYGIKDDALWHENTDVLDGLQFFATLQLRTPLKVLERHGEVFKGPPSQTPNYASPADGCWVPKTKSWADLGIGLRDLPESTAASIIGPVKPSEYVPFLKSFRHIIESDLPHSMKIVQIEALAGRTELFRSFIERHKESDPAFPHSFFYSAFTMIPGIGMKTAKALYDAGYTSIEAIRCAPDDELLAVSGVGPRMIASLKSIA